MATKIRARDPSDDKVVEQFQTETGCGDCETPRWTTPKKRETYNPPEGTVAIVVDIRNNIGGVNIHSRDSGDFVDMVGMEEHGNMVIVPWKSEWDYDCVGSPQVGYIVKKN